MAFMELTRLRTKLEYQVTVDDLIGRNAETAGVHNEIQYGP